MSLGIRVCKNAKRVGREIESGECLFHRSQTFVEDFESVFDRMMKKLDNLIDEA